jgi:hypothetical protein
MLPRSRASWVMISIWLSLAALGWSRDQHGDNAVFWGMCLCCALMAWLVDGERSPA